MHFWYLSNIDCRSAACTASLCEWIVIYYPKDVFERDISLCTWAAGLSSSERWVSPATARAVTSTSCVELEGASTSTVAILVSIVSLSCKKEKHRLISCCLHSFTTQAGSLTHVTWARSCSFNLDCYLGPCILLILTDLRVQHVRHGGEYLSECFTREQPLLLQLSHSVLHCRLKSLHWGAGLTSPDLQWDKQIKSELFHFLMFLFLSLTSVAHHWLMMTNLSADSCGNFLISILHCHHNRQTVIVVLVSEWQEDRFHLICITAAQMFSWKTKETI